MTNFKHEDFKNKVVEAFKGNDVEKLTDELYEMANKIADEKVNSAMEEKMAELDKQVLIGRGQRVLTSEERTYFTNLAEALTSSNPRQAIDGLHDVLPETVVNTVFDELVKEHPFLNAIDFHMTAGITKWLKDAHEEDEAIWGELCDAITKEIEGAIEVVNADLYKLTAFFKVCLSGMEIGPEWLDAYVRQVLKNALANGLEKGFVQGTGNKQPIGMDRDLDEESSGTYAQKDAVAIYNFGEFDDFAEVVAGVTDNGERNADTLALVVNPADYITKVKSAMKYRGEYGEREDGNAYGMAIIQSKYVTRGKAILGLMNRYLGLACLGKEGRITFSDEFKFLDDVRVYKIKLFGNGMPKDNTSFALLDITNVARVKPQVDATITNTTVHTTLDNEEVDVNVTNENLGVTVGNTEENPVNTKEVTE